MSKLFRIIIRASSFFRKEIFDILRQPRLILTLVLGPFIILLLFGIGYHNSARSLRVWFVAQAGSPLAQNIQQYANMMSPQIIDAGLSSNQDDALNLLRRGEVDLVIVAPPDAYNTVLNNQQAVFTFYHGEIDPTQVSYIQYIGVVFVDAVNKQVLISITSNLQKNLGNIHNNLQLAHQNASALRQAVQSGNTQAAQQNQDSLNSNINALSLGIGASLGLLNNVQQTAGGEGSSAPPLQNTLTDLQQNTDNLNHNPASTGPRLANIDKIDQDLTELDKELTTFRSMDPTVIMNPFRAETKSIATLQPTELGFFAPAVLALLLQHMALTFAALSIVRERNSGAMELFRISPLSAGEALLGKYISYMLFGAIIATILSALLILVLKVPMLGSWVYFVLVILALLFTSLGIGFTISLLSQTDSQAVQYCMIFLLACVFFSGFITSLYYFYNPVKIVSWLLPATYATVLLRDITLRGTSPDWLLLGGLMAIGLVFMIISWLLMHRLVSSGDRVLK